MSMKRLIAGGVWLGLSVLPAIGRAAAEPAAQEATAPATYAPVFKFLDRNNDGQVDVGELSVGQQMAALILTLEWTACDADHDGSLSAAEFEQAAAKTMHSLLTESREPVAEDEQRAQEDLAGATALGVILKRLARSPRYADEIAALGKAIEALDDEEEVIAYVTGHPALYPRLGPLVRTWIRTYPVRPELLRYAKPPADVRPTRVGAPPRPPGRRAETGHAPSTKRPSVPARPAARSPHAPPPPAARP